MMIILPADNRNCSLEFWIEWKYLFDYQVDALIRRMAQKWFIFKNGEKFSDINVCICSFIICRYVQCSVSAVMLWGLKAWLPFKCKRISWNIEYKYSPKINIYNTKRSNQSILRCHCYCYWSSIKFTFRVQSTVTGMHQL